MAMSVNADSAWVISPVARQAGGAWIDEVLCERLRESPLGGKRIDAAPAPRGRVEVFRGSDLEAQVNDAFYRRGWTDGLPIVAPTLSRVHETLRYSPVSASEVLGEMEPFRGVVTAEKLAVNAVMAGCRPEYFPVVAAATRAMLDPAFNLRGVQTTDENVAPLLIVSGPLADSIGLNSGIGALGPGWRANATIGRTLRLVMINVGGGWPGVTSLAGIGQPGRYTLCLAENQDASPWPPLHVESGLSPQSSAVTLLRAECSINVTGGLLELASVMASAVSAFSLLHGGCVAALIAPATATEAAARGWRKADVCRYLFERARIPVELWETLWVRRNVGRTYGLPQWVKDAEARSEPIPIVERPEHIIVFVAGGNAPIAQQVYFPTWGFPFCRVVEPIILPREWDSLRDADLSGSSAAWPSSRSGARCA